jgi:hypothetical protein
VLPSSNARHAEAKKSKDTLRRSDPLKKED